MSVADTLSRGIVESPMEWRLKCCQSEVKYSIHLREKAGARFAARRAEEGTDGIAVRSCFDTSTKSI